MKVLHERTAAEEILVPSRRNSRHVMESGNQNPGHDSPQRSFLRRIALSSKQRRSLGWEFKDPKGTNLTPSGPGSKNSCFLAGRGLLTTGGGVTKQSVSSVFSSSLSREGLMTASCCQISVRVRRRASAHLLTKTLDGGFTFRSSAAVFFCRFFHLPAAVPHPPASRGSQHGIF